ncbi:hypothetical protein ABK040_007073 [Willaertia magna]
MKNENNDHQDETNITLPPIEENPPSSTTGNNGMSTTMISNNNNKNNNTNAKGLMKQNIKKEFSFDMLQDSTPVYPTTIFGLDSPITVLSKHSPSAQGTPKAMDPHRFHSPILSSPSSLLTTPISDPNHHPIYPSSNSPSGLFRNNTSTPTGGYNFPNPSSILSMANNHNNNAGPCTVIHTSSISNNSNNNTTNSSTMKLFTSSSDGISPFLPSSATKEERLSPPTTTTYNANTPTTLLTSSSNGSNHNPSILFNTHSNTSAITNNNNTPIGLPSSSPTGFMPTSNSPSTSGIKANPFSTSTSSIIGHSNSNNTGMNYNSPLLTKTITSSTNININNNNTNSNILGQLSNASTNINAHHNNSNSGVGVLPNPILPNNHNNINNSSSNNVSINNNNNNLKDVMNMLPPLPSAVPIPQSQQQQQQQMHSPQQQQISPNNGSNEMLQQQLNANMNNNNLQQQQAINLDGLLKIEEGFDGVPPNPQPGGKQNKKPLPRHIISVRVSELMNYTLFSVKSSLLGFKTKQKEVLKDLTDPITLGKGKPNLRGDSKRIDIHFDNIIVDEASHMNGRKFFLRFTLLAPDKTPIHYVDSSYFETITDRGNQKRQQKMDHNRNKISKVVKVTPRYSIVQGGQLVKILLNQQIVAASNVCVYFGDKRARTIYTSPHKDNTIVCETPDGLADQEVEVKVSLDKGKSFMATDAYLRYVSAVQQSNNNNNGQNGGRLSPESFPFVINQHEYQLKQVLPAPVVHHSYDDEDDENSNSNPSDYGQQQPQQQQVIVQQVFSQYPQQQHQHQQIILNPNNLQMQQQQQQKPFPQQPIFIPPKVIENNNQQVIQQQQQHVMLNNNGGNNISIVNGNVNNNSLPITINNNNNPVQQQYIFHQ